MAEDTGLPDPYDVVLADLKAKRDQIDQAIAALMALKGQSVQSIQQVSQKVESAEITAVQPGVFLGLTIADAVKRLLTMRKTPLGTQEITEALIAGGVVFTSETPANTVGSVLHRQIKIGTDVVSVGRGKWALASWFQNPSRFQKKKPGDKSQTAAQGEGGESSGADPEGGESVL